ncbi:MAG TPA: hypothetical protein VGQ86_01635 [Candidatus Limnocylindria bacterium]|nr:hypothetical protein [Candidatus Limnocylindria bacterium]
MRRLAFVICALAISCGQASVSNGPTPTASTAPSPSASPSPTAVPLPSGWTAVTKTEFSVGLPPTWRAIELDPQTVSASFRALRDTNPTFAQSYDEAALAQLANAGLKMFAFDLGPGGTSGGFATNMNISITALNADVSLDFLAQTSAAQVEVQLNATRKGLDKVSLGGRDAMRLRATYPLTVASGPLTVAATQYYVLRGRDVFVLTFSTRQESKDALAATFEQIAQTFRIV